MDKQAASKFAQALEEAKTVSLNLAAERDFYREKCASFERREQATKVASAMHAKGIHTDRSLDELTNEMMKAAEEGRLETVQNAVDMVAPNMGMKIATVSDERSVGAGESSLERFIMGGVG